MSPAMSQLFTRTLMGANASSPSSKPSASTTLASASWSAHWPSHSRFGSSWRAPSSASRVGYVPPASPKSKKSGSAEPGKSDFL